MKPEDRRSLDELLAADEAPMRRELRRQIASLEAALSELRRDYAPYEPLPPGPDRPPAILTTAELEHVRDDLIARIQLLKDRLAARFAVQLEQPLVDLTGEDEASAAPQRIAALWRRLRR